MHTTGERFDRRPPPRFQAAALGENSTVRVGLALGLAGFLAGSVWWAAALQTKVDALLQQSADAVSELRRLNAEFSDLKTRVRVLEKAAVAPSEHR